MCVRRHRASEQGQCFETEGDTYRTSRALNVCDKISKAVQSNVDHTAFQSVCMTDVSLYWTAATQALYA